MTKIFSIGQMRSTAYFMFNTPGTNSTGDRAAVVTGGNDSYSLMLVTRCRLRKRSGSRFLDLGEITNQQSYEMYCRFQTALEGNLRNDVKIIIDLSRYTIGTWEKVDEKKSWYKFTLNVDKVFEKNQDPIVSTISGAVLNGVLAVGSVSFTDALLISTAGHTVSVSWVVREGQVYSFTNGVVGDLQFGFDSIAGTITFKADNPGNINGEKLLIAYNVI